MYMAVGISGFSHLNNKIGELISCHSFFAAGWINFSYRTVDIGSRTML